jgi:hypothetical protein
MMLASRAVAQLAARPAVLLFAVLLAGCSSSATLPPFASPSPLVTAPQPAPASPTAAATQFPAPAVPIDDALLEVLPEEVEGLPVVATDEALVEAVGDPGLLAFADAVAAGLAVDPTTGDLVYATVVRPREVPVPEATYLDWRDSFDEGVCAQAGGVSGLAEAEIGGRQTFIGSCAGGVRTYHVWLGNHQLLVSVSATGERRFGEQLVEGLQD